MAYTGNPYVERMIYSPQATAARGIRSTVPVRFYLGRVAPLQTGTPTVHREEGETEKLKRVADMLYAPPDKSTVDWGGPPGEAMDMSNNAVASGLVSPETANTVENALATTLGFEKGEHGYQPTVKGILGIPGLITNPLSTIAKKGAYEVAKWGNEKLGNPLGKAKDNILAALGIGGPSGSSGNIGSGTNPATGHYGGYEGAMFGQAPVSPLADMDLGDSGGGADGGNASGSGVAGGEGLGPGAVGAGY